MDHITIINQIKSYNNIKKAFTYAYYDRINNDYYFDYFELEYVYKNKDKIITELCQDIQNINSYNQRPAYAYFPSKNDLCNRRMIYIPFKDLVIRYAFTIILAKYLDAELSDNCFANRSAKSNTSKKSFLENFATESWPNFCEWQKHSCESYNLLLKTDISSFYDSISHEYLKKIIAESLSIPIDCDVINLFEKLLKVQVISYSTLSCKAGKPQTLKQGLPIGNNTEGFLANVYLKNVDETMQLDNVNFGRYNDDMRIFSNEKPNLIKAVNVLQELLLSKGLNLNSSKTELAENNEEMEELRSKVFDVSATDFDELGEDETQNSNLFSRIDKPFEDFDKIFEEEEVLNNKLAKDFCKSFMAKNSNNMLIIPHSERLIWHIERFCDIMKKWKGSSKHASWLLIQSVFFKDIPPEVKKLASKKVFELLKDPEVSTYGKYRILHHLVKNRNHKSSKFRYLDKFEKREIQELKDIAVGFLQLPAFELNIISLYLIRILGSNKKELEHLITSNIKRPIPDPIKNALSYLDDEESETKELIDVSDFEIEDIPEPY